MREPAVAIVLAAGEGSRFAGPRHKLDAEIDGRSLLRRALDAATASGIGPVLVVVPADGDRSFRTDLPAGVAAVVNAEWRRGSASSLQAGLARAAELGAQRAVIALADQPFIAPEAWRAVAAADAPLAVATYDGRARPPGAARAPSCGRCSRRRATKGPRR